MKREDNHPNVVPRRPNLFIIGAMKAATTSLHSYLGQHQEIEFCIPKEPNFFGENGRRASGELSLQAYESLFAQHTGRYSGESTVKYLPSITAASEIWSFNREARIVVSLRNPIDRAYSHYWHDRKSSPSTATFAKVVERELLGRGESTYLQLGLYHEQLARFIELFGNRCVKVILAESLADDGAKVCRSVFEFLGVDPTFPVDVRERLNPSGTLRFSSFRRVILGNTFVRRVALACTSQEQRSRLVWQLDNLLVSKKRTPAIDPRTRELLAGYFSRDVEKLRTTLDLQLRAWEDWT